MRRLPHLSQFNSEFRMRMFLALFAVFALQAQAPPRPKPVTLWSVAEGDVGMLGDSLKAQMLWRSPPDSVTVGPVDSTIYRLTVSKDALFFGGKVLTANVEVQRRIKGAATSDSLKFAKPALGDSVVLRVRDFRQCRKNDCSAAAEGGFVYKNGFTPPPPSAPGFRVVPL